MNGIYIIRNKEYTDGEKYRTYHNHEYIRKRLYITLLLQPIANKICLNYEYMSLTTSMELKQEVFF